MCTSKAAKPARSNAAAISTWPLTPCSRRTAMRGPHAGGDERRRDVLGRIERELHRRRGILAEQPVVFLVGGLRMVAQPLQRVRGGGPRAVQVDPRLVEQHLLHGLNDDAAARRRRADDRGTQARAAGTIEQRLRERRRHLHHGADLLGEQRGERWRVDGVQRDVEAAARGEGHLGERGEQAAVADVVVGEQRSGRARFAHERGTAPRARRAARRAPRRRAGRRPAPAPSRRAAARPPEASSSTSTVSPRSSASCGVSVGRTSASGAKADTISDTGATTARSRPSPSFHAVRIDIESLPTGMERPSAMQNSLTASTVVVERRVLARVPRGRHPVGGELDVAQARDRRRQQVRDRLGHRDAARTPARRSSASGVRSPIAMASPA